MTRGSTGTEIANRVYYFRKFFKPIVSLMIFIFPLVINKKYREDLILPLSIMS
jgi:hypothetical protein